MHSSPCHTQRLLRMSNFRRRTRYGTLVINVMNIPLPFPTVTLNYITIIRNLV